MKKLILSLLLSVVAISISAQVETTATIRGAVIDQNGNPLPGASVTASGGAETVMVESDGTFEMEVPIWLKYATAKYVGLSNEKMKVDFNSPMIFRMHPKNRFGFINVAGGASISASYSDCPVVGTVGVMGGSLGNWGMYGKVLFCTSGYGAIAGTHVIVGAIKQVYKNIYLYLGAGYGGISDYYYDYNYDYNYGWYQGAEHPQWDAGFAFDLGLIVRLGNHFNLTAGSAASIGFYDNSVNITPNLSVGYCF